MPLDKHGEVFTIEISRAGKDRDMESQHVASSPSGPHLMSLKPLGPLDCLIFLQ
jgi:hypothetical protein